MLEKFCLEAQRIISSAESLSFDLSHNSIASEHFLLAVLKIPDNLLTIMLKKYGITFKSVVNDIKHFEVEQKQDIFFMEYDDSFKKILDEAQTISKEYKEDKVSVNVMLISFLKNLSGICREMFNKNRVDTAMLLATLIKNQKKHSELDKIIDLHDLSKIKKDPLIGRKKELQQLILALRRRNKPNAILVGAPGVGKTAIVEELARLISENKVPGLENKRIYELDIASVVGGTKYRGEFEDKLKKIIKNVNEDGNAILFIDEIHNIIKAGGAEGAIDASNILKPYLSRGDIQIIGATTSDEYHNIFLKDKALNRRFQIIFVDPSSKEETLDILTNLKPIYEEYYRIEIDDEMTKYIVEIADEFIPNQSFPDKALDILDNSCVMSSGQLTKNDINKMVEKFYNVSITKEPKALKVKKELEKEIYGQKEAIEVIYKALLGVEYGLSNDNSPLVTMLFVGPSGVGKTECAKIIAREYYQSTDSLIKLDMACFQDHTSVNKLIGAAPGYQDSDNLTSFVRKIKNHPNSVVLLDEIDKASVEVLDFFLNIFDEGCFVDSHNNIINCRNVIFIMTSNAGNEVFDSKMNFNIGQTEDKNSGNNVYKALLPFFRSEFLNRISYIVEFNYIDIETSKLIGQKYVNKRVINEETTFEFIDKLSLNESKVKASGARYIKRLVLDAILNDINKKNRV